MKYEILNDAGEVTNIIVADIAFVESQYPGKFRELPELVVQDPTEYQRQRAREYPPMADYIDGIVKGDQAQVQAYIDVCLAVKAKYPKP
jgi:hypothetical protein